ncbi:MAG: hypothetical protein K0R63_365 [Rickettsiales bacterium]|jgi:erythromycin esterase-like protein/predicted phosphoribosyltransferase|nr:hypothetical protein [Rickettsiales bacterium]
MLQPFRDRKAAGKHLAEVLSEYKGRKDTLVLGLPRGGVPVAYEVATALSLPLEVLLVRKLGVPGYEELAMGAIAWENICFINQDIVSRLGIPEAVIKQVVAKEQAELLRRNERYRGNKPPPQLEGKAVIVVDDGLATGATMRAAVLALRQAKAAFITVAVPVGAPSTCSELESIADQVVCQHTPEPFDGVGRWYRDFSQISDAEVQELLCYASESPGIITTSYAIEIALVKAIQHYATPLGGATSDYEQIISTAKNKRLVLIGEASHGTQEFYYTRAEITKRLIDEIGFDAIAVEADWPDAYKVNRYVSHLDDSMTVDAALGDFERFPTWMWRNQEILRFMRWLHAYNNNSEKTKPVGFYGLDLYSLSTSIHAVLLYLDKVDPLAASRARIRYACLDHFMDNPQSYGYATEFGLVESCEKEIVSQLIELRQNAYKYMKLNGFSAEDEYFYAEQNAKLICNAEEYYRSLFRGRPNSWNVRDQHMFETLEDLIKHITKQSGRDAKIVVWAHNSHVGNAAATEMSGNGEYNIGQLVRESYKEKALLVGFSTSRGTVTAASEWDAPIERKRVRDPLSGSYEEIFHHVNHKQFLINLQENNDAVDLLMEPRLQRAIGVIYRPDTERYSHYFKSCLPQQFDFLLHYDETHAVEPLETTPHWHRGELDETYPTGF